MDLLPDTIVNDPCDALLEERALAFRSALPEAERDLLEGALNLIELDQDRNIFWHWVRRIQQVLPHLTKDEARETLNYLLDEW